ncbi:hypothetical protein BKA83DRAFT_4129920 [Pisolithus microcarpus]|nr:hypothetical protein BKA83DRAFT_4129920 [Pisolithus microcarpus]
MCHEPLGLNSVVCQACPSMSLCDTNLGRSKNVEMFDDANEVVASNVYTIVAAVISCRGGNAVQKGSEAGIEPILEPRGAVTLPNDPISAPTGCTIPTLQAEPQASDSSKASEL